MLLNSMMLSLLLSSSVARAQMTEPMSTPAVVAPAIAASPTSVGPDPMRQISLAPNTEVTVTPNDTLSSKSLKVGDTFRVATVFDVMQDGFVVIPRGTVGEGTVTYRTGKGAFGKSAKFEVVFNWIELAGRHIPLTGKFRAEGNGNTGAAVGAAVAVGVFGAFVTGHSATITNGEPLRAYTAEPIAFEVPINTVAVRTAILAAPLPTAAAVTPASVSK